MEVEVGCKVESILKTTCKGGLFVWQINDQAYTHISFTWP